MLALDRAHRRGLGGVLTLAALCLGGAAIAQEPQPGPAPEPEAAAAPASKHEPDARNFTPYQMLRRPTPAEISPLYPERALREGKTGKVQVVCEIGLSTQLENCVVTSEDPPGLGFGETAIKTAAFFRVKPPVFQGEPVPHAKLSIPMSFAIAPPPVKTLEDRERARAEGTLPPERPEPPAETEAERTKRLGPLRRSPDVLWAPLLFAGWTLFGLAWVNFISSTAPPPRRPRRKRGLYA